MSIAAGPWRSVPRSVRGAGEYQDLADVPAPEREGRLKATPQERTTGGE